MRPFALLLACSVLAAPAIADDYRLRLFSIDDDMYVYIFNSAHSGTLVARAGFSSNNPAIDLNPFIAPGTNWLLLELFNGPKGWTYGLEFTRNGERLVHDVCGIWNRVGCDNNKYHVGRVWEGVIRFDTEGSDVAYEWGFKYDSGTPRWSPPPPPPPPVVAPPSGVGVIPEPATWAMLIAGFGLVGAALRRRRLAAA